MQIILSFSWISRIFFVPLQQMNKMSIQTKKPYTMPQSRTVLLRHHCPILCSSSNGINDTLLTEEVEEAW